MLLEGRRLLGIHLAIQQVTDDLVAPRCDANALAGSYELADGTTLAFASDRGIQTDFERLTFSDFQLALLDVSSGDVQVLNVHGNVKHMNPQYAPDGRSLYFISDQDGFSDIYNLDFQTGETRRITNLATGVSGITYMSPAMSLAANTGRLVYSVFDEREFHIYARVAEDRILEDFCPVRSEVLLAQDTYQNPGRKLPPVSPTRFSRVAAYLDDPSTGLPPAGTYEAMETDEYDSSLSLDYIGQPSLGVGTDNFGNYVGGGASAYFSDMLGNRVLGVALQAQGTFKDIGGQVFYQDLSDRWNWGVGAGRIPYLLGYYDFGSDDIGQYIGQQRFRVFISSLSGQVAYPFSSTRRFELGLGMSRYSYDLEVDKFYVDQFGRVIDFRREQLDDQEPDPLNLVEASAALVGDNAFFGFVSPIRGGRYRLEVEQTVGTVDFTTIIADWRRYFAPSQNLTIGVRGLHYGRYGLTARENEVDEFGLLNPLFLGFETFVRGYAFESFEGQECALSAIEAGVTSGCPAFDRLRGQQLAVSSVELRVPFIGVERYGIINFPFLPTELVAFADAGLAWDENNQPVLEWSRSSAERVPVFSTGVSARMNILGFMILEAYYAYPWQRPDKGWHWGFQIAPGW